MKKLITISLLLSSLQFSYSTTTEVNSFFCNIVGSVFFTSVKSESNISIFIQESEGFADLSVFKVDDVVYADRPGLWHITEERAFADHIIYIEEEEGFASFSVFFTDIEAFAGCND